MRMIGGTGGELLAALLVAGACAAFLSTSSGLTIAVAGVLSQDLMNRWLGGIASFRVAAVIGVSVAYTLAVLAEDVGVATAVGLAFAVAASTFCPLLVLGIWWRRLTDVGAIAGLLVGGVTSGAAVVRTFVATEDSGWYSTLLAQPAAWTVPLAFTAMVVGSLLTPDRQPVHATRFMVRLHTPEAVGVDRG
jgi:Na+(H+)/acetate symporter ActP